MSVCVQSIVKRRLGGVFGGAILLVAGSVSTGLALGHFLTRQDKPDQATIVTKTFVLQDSEWLSESYWKRRKQKKLRQRANSFAGRSNLGFNPFDQDTWQQPATRNRARRDGGTYRTVCVRLCDGYYFPVSFSTTRDRFAKDEQACQSRCSSDSRLYYYRNSNGSPETMVDRGGRAYADLRTAFLYRTSYSKSCQCKPDPWSTEAKQRHAMYATKEWQRKARRLARKERKQARYARRSSRGNPRIVAPQAFAVPGGYLQTPEGVVIRSTNPGKPASRRYSQAQVKQVSPTRRQPTRRSRNRRKKNWKSAIFNRD